ncbi:MAG: HPr family phosphocarrier protein [Proteobacteria bacterium]|nr:HPr family phosphocarrier protein [Pseudomonadota bacterium]
MNRKDCVERTFTVQGELGLHARPAGRLVAAAGRFQCEIEVGRAGEWVSGRSVLSILSLAAGPGTVLSVRATGVDAEAAVETLGALIENPEEASGPPA